MTRLYSTLSFLIISLIPFTSSTQEPSIEWGNASEKEESEENIEEIIYASDNAVYGYVKEGSIVSNQFYLVKFDQNLNQVWRKRMDPPPSEGTRGNSLTMEHLLAGNDKFIKLSRGWYKDKEKSTYVVQEVRLDGTIGEPVILHEHPSEKMTKRQFYTPILSPDRSKLLVYTQHPFDRKENEKITVSVNNTHDWSKVFSEDYVLDYEDDRAPQNKFTVDNDGNAYFFKRVKIDRKTYDYNLYGINAENPELKKHELDFGELHTNKFVSLSINKNGHLVMTGCYSDDRFDDAIKGLYYYRINPETMNVEASSMEPLSDDLHQTMNGEPLTRDNWKLSESFEIRDVLHYSDGSSAIMLEYYDVTKSPNSSASEAKGTPVYDYEYTALDIVLICFNPDGSSKWNQQIEKKQSDHNQDGEGKWDSFAYTFRDDILKIVWNNTEINKSLTGGVQVGWKEEDGQTYGLKEEFGERCVYGTFMYEVGSNGNIRFEDYKYGLPLRNMFQEMEYYVVFKPRVSFQSDNGLIIYAETKNQGKRYVIGRLGI